MNLFMKQPPKIPENYLNRKLLQYPTSEIRGLQKLLKDLPTLLRPHGGLAGRSWIGTSVAVLNLRMWELGGYPERDELRRVIRPKADVRSPMRTSAEPRNA
ncbi:MAG: hypothetical protein ACTSXX_02710 [Candidatus Baldrarchaeia archaeon]